MLLKSLQRTQLKLLQKEPFKKKSGATVDLISNKTAHKIYIYIYPKERQWIIDEQRLKQHDNWI